MPRTWLFPGLLLAVFAAASLAQQAADAPSEQERLVHLDEQVRDMQRTLAALAGDGTLEARFARIEMRLDRLEQQVLRSSSSAGVSSDRMMEGRLRTLENAVMRLQQQR